MTSTSPDQEWLGVLHVAKQIRRNVHPVAPSAGFRRHLHSDLTTALTAHTQIHRDVSRSIVVQTQQDRSVLVFLLGGCLGLAAVSLALIFLRRSRR